MITDACCSMGESWKYFAKWKKESAVAQLCPTLCNPMDYSPPGSSIHGIFQARVLEWIAISFPEHMYHVVNVK